MLEQLYKTGAKERMGILLPPVKIYEEMFAIASSEVDLHFQKA